MARPLWKLHNPSYRTIRRRRDNSTSLISHTRTHKLEQSRADDRIDLSIISYAAHTGDLVMDMTGSVVSDQWWYVIMIMIVLGQVAIGNIQFGKPSGWFAAVQLMRIHAVMAHRERLSSITSICKLFICHFFEILRYFFSTVYLCKQMYEVRMFQFFFFIIFVRRIYAMYIHLYWPIFGINYFCLISKHRTDQMHAKEKKKTSKKQWILENSCLRRKPYVAVVCMRTSTHLRMPYDNLVLFCSYALINEKNVSFNIHYSSAVTASVWSFSQPRVSGLICLLGSALIWHTQRLHKEHKRQLYNYSHELPILVSDE